MLKHGFLKLEALLRQEDMLKEFGLTYKTLGVLWALRKNGPHGLDYWLRAVAVKAQGQEIPETPKPPNQDPPRQHNIKLPPSPDCDELQLIRFWSLEKLAPLLEAISALMRSHGLATAGEILSHEQLKVEEAVLRCHSLIFDLRSRTPEHFDAFARYVTEYMPKHFEVQAQQPGAMGIKVFDSIQFETNNRQAAFLVYRGSGGSTGSMRWPEGMPGLRYPQIDE